MTVSREARCSTLAQAPGRRAYRRGAGGTCSICHHLRVRERQRTCERCHALERRYYRLKAKAGRTLEQDIALVKTGVTLLALRCGFDGERRVQIGAWE